MTASVIQTGQQSAVASPATNTIVLTLVGVTAGSTIVVFLTWGTSVNSGATASVADATNGAYTLVAPPSTLNDAAIGQKMAAYYFKSSASGSLVITGSFSATNFSIAMAAMECGGVDTVSPLDGSTGQVQNPSPGTGANAVTSGTFSNTKQPALIVGCSLDNITGSPTAGTGFTDNGAIWDFNGNAGGAKFGRLESKRVTATGLNAATFTGLTGNKDITIALALDEIGASGGALTAYPWADPQQQQPPPPRSRTVEVSAPVGALMSPAVLSSVGWNVQPHSQPPTARPSNPQPVQPTGNGTFALAKTGWMVTERQQVVAQARPQPQIVDGGGQPAALMPYLDQPVDLGARRTAPPLVVTASEPVGSRITTALTSSGWQTVDTRSPPPLSPRAQEAQQPSGPLAPFVSTTLGWQAPDMARAIQPNAQRPDMSAPVGALMTPTTSLGWFGIEARTSPVSVPRSASVDPVGTLISVQQVGWNVGHDQARPAPTVSRRVEPVAPIGTMIAQLPTNGWLATDNPRTPLALGRSAPTDPVGNLLVPAALPNITWLTTENPRTPLTLQRAVVVDPVGTKLPLPGALGPYWVADMPRGRVAPAARVASSEPVGSLSLAALTSIGWLSPFDLPRAPVAARRVEPTDPLRALQFGGTPWATVDVTLGRPASARLPETAAPVGTLIQVALPNAGWFSTDLPRTVITVRRPEAAAPIGTLIGAAGLSSLGWMQPDVSRVLQPTRSAETSAPIGALLGLPSIGWQVSEMARPKASPTPAVHPTQAHLHTALAFTGTPWASVEVARQPQRPPQNQEQSAPFGRLVLQLTSLGWVSPEPAQARLVPRQVSTSEPVGPMLPPVVLPSMGWQSVVELPTLWHFTSRPVPSEPIGAPFTGVFVMAGVERMSPVFDRSSSRRVSPIF